MQFAYDMMLMEANNVTNFLQELSKDVSFYDDMQVMSEKLNTDLQPIKAYIDEMADYFAQNPDAEIWDGDLDGFLASIEVIKETSNPL